MRGFFFPISSSEAGREEESEARARRGVGLRLLNVERRKEPVGRGGGRGGQGADSVCVCVTRYTTTLNPKAGLGLQRWSVRRQPVVQAQILVVQGLLCGNSSEKMPYYRKKALAYRGKGGQNTGNAFLALRLGVVLYLLSLFVCLFVGKSSSKAEMQLTKLGW